MRKRKKSVGFPVPKLFIIVPFYAPPSFSFFAAAALLPPPLFACVPLIPFASCCPARKIIRDKNDNFPFTFVNK